MGTPAHALNRDVRAVLITSGYGVAAGTILGLASFPLNQNPRSIFIGSSVGLYLGIAVGVYYIFHRYSPENPLHMQPEPAPPWAPPKQGPTQDDFNSKGYYGSETSSVPEFQFNVVLVQF